MMFRSLIGILSAIVLVSSASAEQRKVTFALNWSPTDHHIAYWVALDKGYYARQGLDVDLQNSKGSGDALAKVDTGRAQFALADITSLVPAIARGAKLKMIGVVFNNTPLAIFTWKDSPIKAPKDLEGKTLGSPPGDAHRTFFPAFAKAADIDASKVSWLNINPAAKVGALTAKRVDAIADFTTIRPLYEKAMGEGNVRAMPWSQFQFDLYGIGIVTRDDILKKDPELTRKFLKASYEGWRDVFADPDAAVKIFKKYVPELDASLISKSLRSVTMDLVKTPATVANGIGWIDRKKMCGTVDLINESVKLPRKVDCDEAYSAAMLPVVKFAGK